MHKNPIHIGAVTLMTVFVVLCLAVFSVLSLTSARQSLALAEKSAAAAADYWTADKALCDRVNDLSARYEAGGLSAALVWAEENDAVLEATEEGTVITLSVTMNEQNDLAAVLSLEEGIRILSWRQVPTGTWEPDLSIPVWQGEAAQ